MRRAARSLAACLAVHGALGWPRDLGSLGPTYPIGEQDLLQQIHDRLQASQRNGELVRLQAAATRRALDTVANPPPVAGLTTSDVARSFYFDPSTTLTRNVLDAQGRLLFPAGTRKNPLEVVALSKRLLFLDARDPRQVARAEALMAGGGQAVKPILTGGPYLTWMKRWRRPVYYDQGGVLVHRLGILHLPALVSQAGLRLRIDELAVRP